MFGMNEHNGYVNISRSAHLINNKQTHLLCSFSSSICEPLSIFITLSTYFRQQFRKLFILYSCLRILNLFGSFCISMSIEFMVRICTLYMTGFFVWICFHRFSFSLLIKITTVVLQISALRSESKTYGRFMLKLHGLEKNASANLSEVCFKCG